MGRLDTTYHFIGFDRFIRPIPARDKREYDLVSSSEAAAEGDREVA